MKLRLTTDEMLNQWRLCRALEPLRLDCTVERLDGIDADKYLLDEMNGWYLKLLDTAPAEMLTLTDISKDVTVESKVDGEGVIKLPERCRRVMEIQLGCWQRPARIVEPDSPTAQLQDNPYSRGGTAEPVAVKRHRRLHLYSIPPETEAEIAALYCVMEPEEGFYEMDERALSLIGSYEP